MDTSIAADWHKEFDCGWIRAGPKSPTTNNEVRDTSVEIRNDQKDIRACRDDQLLSLRGIPVFPCQPARLSHPGAGLARTTPDIVVRACVSVIDVVDTKQYRLKKSLHWLVRQYTEFIVAVQPMALFRLLTTLTRAVFGIEILILRAFLHIQISQQHDAWISELLYDSSPHCPLVVPVCGGDASH